MSNEIRATDRSRSGPEKFLSLLRAIALLASRQLLNRADVVRGVPKALSEIEIDRGLVLLP